MIGRKYGDQKARLQSEYGDDMGWRFRKSIDILGIRHNLSRSGIGASVGAGPFRIGRSSTGKDYASASLSGTGLSWLGYLRRRRNGQITNALPISPQTSGTIGVPSMQTPNQTRVGPWWTQKGL